MQYSEIIPWVMQLTWIAGWCLLAIRFPRLFVGTAGRVAFALGLVFGLGIILLIIRVAQF